MALNFKHIFTFDAIIIFISCEKINKEEHPSTWGQVQIDDFTVKLRSGYTTKANYSDCGQAGKISSSDIEIYYEFGGFIDFDFPKETAGWSCLVDTFNFTERTILWKERNKQGTIILKLDDLSPEPYSEDLKLIRRLKLSADYKDSAEFKELNEIFKRANVN